MSWGFMVGSSHGAAAGLVDGDVPGLAIGITVLVSNMLMSL